MQNQESRIKNQGWKSANAHPKWPNGKDKAHPKWPNGKDKAHPKWPNGKDKAHPEWPNGLSGCEEQKGYSLIEVLIYSSILALFLLLVVQVFIAVKNANAHSTAFVGVQRNLRQIVADLGQTIRMAETVGTPLPGQSGTTLSLNEGAVTYQLNSGVLQKTTGGQTWNLTTDEVTISNLSFENAVEATQTATIKVEMDIESNYLLEGGRRLSESLQTTVSLR